MKAQLTFEKTIKVSLMNINRLVSFSYMNILAIKSKESILGLIASLLKTTGIVFGLLHSCNSELINNREIKLNT